MGLFAKTIRVLFRSVGLSVKRINPADDNWLWVQNLGIITVVDVGANVGQFAGMIHGILPQAAIYSFEPLAECYQEMLQRMKEVPRFRAFNYAIGEENTEIEIHRSSHSPSSSILKMSDLHKRVYPHSAGKAGTQKCAVRRLDDFMQDLDLAEPILVKIDVQGYEDKVIRGATRLLSRTSVIIIETSFKTLYEGQLLFDEIYGLLRPIGFSFKGNLAQTRDPADGSVLYADSIFIKP